ncbi:MAG: patatin-like phospholipase family protein, partial [Bacteroidia bacterium]
ASASIPIIFVPVTINGKHYADGGLSGNLPTEPFKNSPLKTIGVHVNPLDHFNPDDSLLKQFERALHLTIKGNVIREMQDTNLLIEPGDLKNYGLFDTKKIDEIIEIGYNYVKEKVDLNALNIE